MSDRILSIGNKLSFGTKSVRWGGQRNIKNYDFVFMDFLNLDKIVGDKKISEVDKLSTEFIPSKRHIVKSLKSGNDIIAILPERKYLPISHLRNKNINLFGWIPSGINVEKETGSFINNKSIEKDWKWYFDGSDFKWYLHFEYDDKPQTKKNELTNFIKPLVLNKHNRSLACKVRLIYPNGGVFSGSIYLIPLLESWGYENFAYSVLNNIFSSNIDIPKKVEESSIGENTGSQEKKVSSQMSNLKEKISELNSKNEEKEGKLNELENINQILRHDVRNDINIISMYAQELKDKKYGITKEFDETKLLEKIIEKSSHINELTILSRDIADIIDEGIEIKRIEIKNSIENCVSEIKNEHPSTEFEIEEIPDVYVKSNKFLNQLFKAIIKNGIHHNDKQTPKINISGSIDKKNNILINIKDNGPGIPEYIKKEMNQFNKNKDVYNIGLGLYFVNKIIKKYNGDIDIKNNTPEGTIFTVKLPLDQK